MTSQSLDVDAQERLAKLKGEKLGQVLTERSDTFELEWNGTNLESRTDSKLEQYLTSFCDRFISDVKSLIVKSVSNRESAGGSANLGLDAEDTELYQEIIHHLRFANSKLALFCGREDELAQIRHHLTKTPATHAPVIVHAPSGHGKTSLLAKCLQQVPDWMGAGDVSVIVRFFGTSPNSSNIRDSLSSVVRQLAALLDCVLPPRDEFEKMGNVRYYFNLLLDLAAKEQSAKSFVIILDSVDQLSAFFGAYRFAWLPRTLPANVNIIVSLLSDFGDLLQNCKNRLQTTTTFLSLASLSGAAADDVISAFLAQRNRKLLTSQRRVVLTAFERHAQPLYLKLVLDRAAQWSSYTALSDVITKKSSFDWRKWAGTWCMRVGRLREAKLYGLGCSSCGAACARWCRSCCCC